MRKAFYYALCVAMVVLPLVLMLSGVALLSLSDVSNAVFAAGSIAMVGAYSLYLILILDGEER